MLSAFALLAQVPPPPPAEILTKSMPNRLRVDERATLVNTNRVRCTNDCPPARSNVTFSWRGESKLEWSNSISPNITHYTLYWGPDSRSLTNSRFIGLALNAFPTNLPAGTNYVAVTATDDDGLESDFSNSIAVNIFRDWLLYDLTEFPSNPKVWKRTTNYSEVVALPTANRLLRVKGTNALTKESTRYVGVSVR